MPPLLRVGSRRRWSNGRCPHPNPVESCIVENAISAGKLALSADIGCEPAGPVLSLRFGNNWYLFIIESIGAIGSCENETGSGLCFGEKQFLAAKPCAESREKHASTCEYRRQDGRNPAEVEVLSEKQRGSERRCGAALFSSFLSLRLRERNINSFFVFDCVLIENRALAWGCARPSGVPSLGG